MTSRAASPPSRRTSSSVVRATVAAIVVGVAFIAFLVVQNPAPTVSALVMPPVATTPPALAHDRSLGDPAAPLTLDVWSDFQCPYCEQFWTSVEPSLVDSFVQAGKVRLVNHDFVFIGPESVDAAVAARCADQQGRFWQYHDLLFANQGRENSGAFSSGRLTQFATTVGLDTGKWNVCRSDTGIQQAVAQETAAGKALGVNGTPTLFLDGAKLGAFDLNTVSAAIATASGGLSPAAASAASGGSPNGGSSTPGTTP